jgi:signal transduction histidine kinase
MALARSGESGDSCPKYSRQNRRESWGDDFSERNVWFGRLFNLPSDSQILTPAASRYAAEMARAIKPAAALLDRRLSAALRKRGHNGGQVRALLAITPAAAARLRTLPQFLEQVEYNGRRLAKMNVSPAQVREALRDCGALLDPVLGGRFQPAREQLHLATTLTLNEAYYRVREAETQALFGIYRAEAAAVDFDDLLRRLVRVLTPAFQAQAGRIVALLEPAKGKLAKPLYIERDSANARLVADPTMRRRHASFWSYPLGGNLVAQFGFAVKYPWLPRELTLLEAAAERCRAAEERARLEGENWRLQAMAQRAEEEERRRIGRELHDEAGQCLLLLLLQLEMIRRDAPAGLRERLAESRGVAESAVTEIRRIVAALSPSVLERLGLRAAMRHLAGRFRKMDAARLEMRIALGRKAIPHAVEEVVYRVAQESMLNIVKHSGAKWVKLSLRTADSCIRLSVSDDGAGFSDEAAVRKLASFGLAGMRERAALLGGTLAVQSAVGKGVTVRLELPLSEAPGKSNGKNTRIVD